MVERNQNYSSLFYLIIIAKIQGFRIH